MGKVMFVDRCDDGCGGGVHGDGSAWSMTWAIDGSGDRCTHTENRRGLSAGVTVYAHEEGSLLVRLTSLNVMAVISI